MLVAIGLIVTTETQAQGLGGCMGKAPLVCPTQKVGVVIGLSQLLQRDPCPLLHLAGGFQCFREPEGGGAP